MSDQETTAVKRGRPRSKVLKERRTFYLTPEQNRKLEERALELDVPVSRLLKQITTRYLSRV